MQRWIALCLITMVCASTSFTQTQPAKANPGTPPRVLLLVHQQFLPGKSGARQSLEVETARAFDRLDVPATWIELEALTGTPEALFFDPANSFEEIDKAGSALAQLYATHPELGQSQGQIMDMVSSSRTLTALRRDDMSPQADRIDLSKARYISLQVVQLSAAQQREFQDAQGAPQPSSAPSVVYQVNAGMPDGTFLIVTAMKALKELDASLGISSPAPRVDDPPHWGGQTNLYAVRPDMSHVSKGFAEGDPVFWVQRAAP